MTYKMVFFDIDGTLVDEGKNIPEDAKEAIRALKQTGVEVAIATGRAHYHFRHIAEELGIDSYVAFNGAYAVYKGETIYRNPLDREWLDDIARHAAALRHPIVYLAERNCFATDREHPDVGVSFDMLKVDPPEGGERFDIRREDVYEIMLYCRFHDEPHYAAYKNHAFIRAHEVYMDVIKQGETKAKGIEEMIRRLGIAPAEVVAFGDGFNDVEMLTFVGMGVAMGNAPEGVRAAANYTTRRVEDGGIRHALEHLKLI